MAELNIATYNVNGMRDVLKRRKIFNYIHDLSFNVTFLQETHSSPTCEKFWTSEYGGKIFFDHGTTESRGCAILFSRSFNPIIHDIIRDPDGRYIIIKIQISTTQETIALANVYAPNQDNPDFFHKFFLDTEKIKAEYLVVGGDLNTIMSSKDIKGGKGNSHYKCTEYINEYLENNKLVDIWRILNPDKFRYTFARKKPNLLMERLDYFIISFGLQQYVKNVDILPGYLTDHSIPTVYIRLETLLAPGNGRWMFNTTYLNDEDYNGEVREIIDDVLQSHDQDPFLKLEMIKMLVRGYSIRYGKRKVKSRRLKLLALEKKLLDIETQQAESLKLFSSTSIENQKVLVNKEIEEIRAKKTQCAMFHSNALWVECGEKVTRQFFQTGKKKGTRNSIQRIEDCTGTSIKETNDEILHELYSFYSKLYARKETDVHSTFLQDLHIPQVKPEDYIMLDAPILLQEIEIAVNQLATDKCPGPDGFPINFFKKFMPELKSLLHSVYMQADRVGHLHSSARTGVIALMEKISKNSLKIASWRPLSMLSSDYKIYAKIIANRLQAVLHYLISKEQAGFMKGRNISSNLTELLTVIDYCESNKIDGIITSVDFEKAFDTVSWEAIKTVMKAFGFSDRFVHLVMICFKQFNVSIGNNGHQTARFELERGTKQGCPLSSLVFLLVIETVGLKLKQSKDIQAIEINGLSKLLSQYADDLWTATKFDQKSFRTQFNIFHHFREFTGLSINYNKTEILRIGALAKTDATMYSRLPLHWSDGPIKILGIEFTSDVAFTTMYNYNKALDKVACICKMWSGRSLSLIGKVLIVNVLCISQFLYKFQCLPSPSKSVVDKFQKIIRSFIWSGRKPKISLNRLQQDFEHGGLKLVDLKIKDKSMKIALMMKAIQTDSLSAHIIQEIMQVPVHDIPTCNIESSDLKRTSKGSQLQYDMCKNWCELNYQKPAGLQDLVLQPLWYNSNIRVANRPHHVRKSIMSEIKTVQDILHHSGNRWLTRQEVNQKYPTVQFTFMDHATLISAIPKIWLRLLTINSNKKESLHTRLNKNNKHSKLAYSEFISKIPSVDDKYRYKWEQLLNIELLNNAWTDNLIRTHKLTLSTKLRTFQYKLVNFALVTNTHLFKWGIKPTKLCTFCHSEEEDIIHLLYQCTVTQKKMWKPLTKWLDYFCYIQTDFNVQEIIFNTYKGPFHKMVNTIILIVKQYIYAKKCMNENLEFSQIINMISRTKAIEGYIAHKRNNSKKHQEKWCMYDTV